MTEDEHSRVQTQNTNYTKFGLHNIPIVFKIFPLLTCIYSSIQFIVFNPLLAKLQHITFILIAPVISVRYNIEKYYDFKTQTIVLLIKMILKHVYKIQQLF